MAEITLDYSVNYRVTLDVEQAKHIFPEIHAELEDDESFEEWLLDHAVSSLMQWEDDKLFDEPLPVYVTEFSVAERLG